jgi:subtilase family serine protease
MDNQNGTWMGRFTKAVCVVAAGVAAVGMTSLPSSAAPTRRAVPRSTPTWVAKTKAVSRVSDKSDVAFRVYLAPNGGVDALKADVAAVSDPASSSYRHFLTAAKYHASYDATDATVSRVTRWLKANHLKVTGVEKNHRYLTVTGTAARTQSAFSTTLNRYRRQGRMVQANATPLKVPAAVAPLILTVSGLDTTPRLMKHHAAPPSPGFVNARPCSISYGAVKASRQADFKTPLPKFKGKVLPYAVCGYTGRQLRSAYEGTAATSLDGAGVTVAITDAYASPTIAADAQQYAETHGDSSYTAGQLKQVVAKKFTNEDACGPSDWYGEETLDVEAVHAMAPAANIRYYGAASCFDDDLLKTLSTVVDQNKAQLVSNSWGDTEANAPSDTVAAYEDVFLQGAMQGISFMFSSGDNGDELENTGIKQADYPTSDPFVTSVGGTSDAIDADGKFQFQTGWGTQRYSLAADGKSWVTPTFLYGAGGGSSALFNQPAYQRGVVKGALASTRAVPDVGLDADPTTGMLVGQTQTFPDGVRYGEYRIGGTSLASPLFAGMTALLLQHAGGRLGALNPVIYAQAGSKTFTDVKGTPADAGNVRVDYVNSLNADEGLRYTVRTFNQDSSLPVAAGWDPVTGIGSPNSGWVTSVAPAK